MDAGQHAIRQLKSHYRSGESNIGQDFFQPCLTYCSSYKRASGFFSSSALITWSSALPRLVAGDTAEIQLLISPQLPEGDRQTLKSIMKPDERDRFVQEWTGRIILEAMRFVEGPSDTALRMRLFTWLIATGRLELRIAFPEHVGAPGPFHEKIGVFAFPWGDIVAFTGSANESIMGHELNYESIDVYRSWIDSDAERVQIKVKQFEEAWSGTAHGLRTLPLSADVISKIRALAPKEKPIAFQPNDEQEDRDQGVPNKWRHQDEAVAEFLKAERGILEMATGTGKTRTAIKICQLLASRGEISTIIIATDGTDLLNQWYKEILKLNRQIPTKMPIIRHYEAYHETERFILNPNNKILLISRYALPGALRRLPSAIAKRTLLIHDEVHGLGSPSNIKNLRGLSDDIRFRLGLSATPEREYDSGGNKFIDEHIGPVIFRFELADAIRRGILAPFYYHPIEYIITDEDRERLKSVYAKQAARSRDGHPMSQEELWTDLAFVYKTSKAKLPIFEQFINRNSDLLTRCIIFVETKEYGNDVLDIVHKHNYEFHTYYAEDESEVLQRFADDDIKLLITCHRLSQGIDIRSLETVILFSSARARLETIQRMGRCLRSDPENPDKMANIVDFIRVGDSEQIDPTADSDRRTWLTELAQIRPEVEAS